MRKLYALLLGATAAIALTGCSSSDNIFGQDNPKVRVFNAARRATPITVTANGQVIGSTVAQGELTTETELGPGNYTFVVKNANTGEVLQTTDMKLLETKSNYDLVVFNSGTTADSWATRLTRENEDTTAGMAELTFVGATHFFGNVDVYLVPPGGDIATSQHTTISTLGEDNTVITVAPGTYNLRVFPQGQTTGQLFAQDITVQADHNYQVLMSATGETAPFDGQFYLIEER